jgi:NAD(P)-dependent dehydrogenase (short-subunit alcohol dehydrogenase family)
LILVISDVAPLGSIIESHFDKSFDINVKGVLFTVQKVLPLFQVGGSIMLNSSIGGSKGVEGLSVYGVTKAAVRSFARSWTVELKDRKIRVNALSRGPIATQARSGWPEERVEQFKKSVPSSVPLGRVGNPDEIAKAVAFLASDDSSYITGVELFIDGGLAQI